MDLEQIEELFDSLMWEGEVLEMDGHFQEALERMEQALPLVQQARKFLLENHDTLYETTESFVDKEIRCLNYIGAAYVHQGNPTSALAYFQQSLDINKSIDETSAETAESLNSIGHVYMSQGDLTRALQYYHQALGIEEAISPDSIQTTTRLNNIGQVYMLQGDLTRALEYCQRALGTEEAFIEAAKLLSNIGHIYRSQGDLTHALEYYQRALNEVSDDYLPETVTVLNNIGCVYLSQGDLAHALESFERALDISDALHDPYDEALAGAPAILNNIGQVYMFQGDLTRALASFERALNISETVTRDMMPQAIQIAASLNSIGQVYMLQEDPTRALASFERALNISEALAPNSISIVMDINNIGQVYMSQGDSARALEFFERALNISETTAPQSAEMAASLNSIGQVYMLQEDPARALASFEQALNISEAIASHSAATAESLSYITQVYLHQGDLANAMTYIDRTVTVAESLRLRSGDRAGARFVLSKYLFLFQLAVLSRIERNEGNDLEEAFQYAERLRSRELTERLLSYQITVETEEQQLLLDQERDLTGEEARLTELYALIRMDRLNEEAKIREGGSPGVVATQQVRCDNLRHQEEYLGERLSQIREQIGALEVSIRRAIPAIGAIRAEPVTLNILRTEILDDETLLLSVAYLPLVETEQNKASNQQVVVAVWGIRKGNFIFEYQTRDDIPQTVAAVRTAIEERHQPQKLSAAISSLDWLLPPQKENPDLWKGVKRVVVIPDGPLHEFPFELLACGETTLGENYVVQYAPSVTALSALRELQAHRAPEHSFLGVGINDIGISGYRTLWGVEDHVSEVSLLFANPSGVTQTLLGPAATREAVRDRLRQSRLVYVVTHGYQDAENPFASGIYLSRSKPSITNEITPEGEAIEAVAQRLVGHDLVGLRLPIEVFISAACSTGRSKEIGGAGWMGFGTSLLYAGVQTAIVTLWDVDHLATSRLMKYFFEFFDGTCSASEALYAAKKKLSSGVAFKHPYFWAAFIALGA